MTMNCRVIGIFAITCSLFQEISELLLVGMLRAE